MLDIASVLFLRFRSTSTPLTAMKTTTLSLKLFQPAVLATLAIAIICGLSVRPAQAGYIVTLQQVGPDVVATGSGAMDLTGLSSTFTGNQLAFMWPAFGSLNTGKPFGADLDLYSGLSGPTRLGSGTLHFPNSGSGDQVSISGSSQRLGVPHGYVSGTALSDISSYNNETFGSLGVAPGTYVWSWGTGVNQNFTLRAGVPDSGSSIALLFLSLTALFGASRFLPLRLA
jgi:hypothetical protein